MKALDWIDNLVMSAKYRLHICMEDGCWKLDTVACFLPDYDSPIILEENDKPSYYYCHEHCNGFCRRCGQFWSGIESFDFQHPSYCDNCYDQITDNYDEGQEDDYDFQSDYQDEVMP